MPALVDVRRRIRSVKSTQQITKAMKMVSAAKLRRAQEAMFAARPYARKMLEVLNGLAARAEPSSHPLLRAHGSERALLVVVTADKGLCGAFNANILRAATRFLDQRDAERPVQLELVGRKARDYFRRRRFPIRGERVGVFQPLVCCRSNGSRRRAPTPSSTTSMSQARPRSSRNCFRSTSRRRSGGRCSSRQPPNTAPGWQRWMPRRTTPRR
jgi:hypothetical protein